MADSSINSNHFYWAFKTVCDFFLSIFQFNILKMKFNHLPDLLNTGFTIIDIAFTGLFCGGEHLGARLCRFLTFFWQIYLNMATFGRYWIRDDNVWKQFNYYWLSSSNVLFYIIKLIIYYFYFFSYTEAVTYVVSNTKYNSRLYQNFRNKS